MVAKSGIKFGIDGFEEEARIPLNNGWKGFDLVYVAINLHERKSDAETVNKEDRLILEAMERRKNVDYLLRNSNEYTFEINRIRKEDIDDIVRLYREAYTRYTVEINSKNVWKMVSNPNAVVVTARHEGRIVSIGVGEIGSIDMTLEKRSKKLEICEISDAATLREHRGKGLYQGIIATMMPELTKRVHLIFSEARASEMSVNQATVNSGFVYAGRLDGHCVIGGDEEIKETRNGKESRYGNLNVLVYRW